LTSTAGTVALIDRMVGKNLGMRRPVTSSFDRSAFAGYRFPPEVILLAVR